MANGHAMYIDGKMLGVTKHSFQIYSALAMTQAQWHNFYAAGMADVPSAAFMFNKDSVCELEIEDLSDTEGVLLP